MIATSSPPRAVESGAAQLPRSMTDREFDLLRRHIQSRAGYALPPAKRPILERRLGKRLRELGLRSYGAYYRLLTQGPLGTRSLERQRVLDLVTTNETRFFREQQQFLYIRDTLAPWWIQTRCERPSSGRVRVWSAACSSGQEPYSLAMCLHDRLVSKAALPTEILASDISETMLRHAHRGEYGEQHVAPIPENYRSFYLDRRRTNAGRSTYSISYTLRRLISFERINLLNPQTATGPFDLILCRNVLMFFTEDCRRSVVHSLMNRLTPNGVLMVGHAESLSSLIPELENVSPATYVRRGTAPHLTGSAT